jgi:hypothetical protein
MDAQNITLTQRVIATPHTVFIHRDDMDWGPTDQPQHLGEDFIVPLYNEDIVLHDYHLHLNNTTTIRNYWLKFFLQTIRGVEPPAMCQQQEQWCPTWFWLNLLFPTMTEPTVDTLILLPVPMMMKSFHLYFQSYLHLFLTLNQNWKLVQMRCLDLIWIAILPFGSSLSIGIPSDFVWHCGLHCQSFAPLRVCWWLDTPTKMQKQW